MEDKVVQHAVVTVLNHVYEEDFLGFSYGLRPGRSQHDALDTLWLGIMGKKVNWVLDADIRGFLDTVPHEPLMARVRSKVADGRVLALIESFLTQRVMDGLDEWTPTSGSRRGR